MENWGLITYREARLLVDEATTSTSAKRDVARVVCHELRCAEVARSASRAGEGWGARTDLRQLPRSHQWFGNLVRAAGFHARIGAN
jgi:hypothetical protein